MALSEYLKQSAYTPEEITRLEGAFNRVMAEIGTPVPLGFREAIAAEIME